MSNHPINPGEVTLTIRPQGQQVVLHPDNAVALNAVRDSWAQACASLTDEEKKAFESHACVGLNMYMEKITAACEKNKKESPGLKILKWFEPLQKAAMMFMPAISTAVQAYPNPGSLVLGGIMGVLAMTQQVYQYQKLLLRKLEMMGSAAWVLLEYETDLYKDEGFVQEALAKVIIDIVKFCTKAFRFVHKNNDIKLHMTGIKCSLFREFDAHLGAEVADFEKHMAILQERALVCDKRRLHQLSKDIQPQHEEVSRSLSVIRGSQETQQNQFATAYDQFSSGLRSIQESHEIQQSQYSNAYNHISGELREIQENQSSHQLQSLDSQEQILNALSEIQESQESQQSQFADAQRGNLELAQLHDATLLQIQKRQEEIRIRDEERLLQERKGILLRWLSTVDYEPVYDSRCREHLHNTGLWLIESDEYKHWIDNPSSDLLWICGKPGCGKSVLAAVVVLDIQLRLEEDEAFAYAFCRGGDESSASPWTVIRALAKQICQRQPQISSKLMDEFEASGRDQAPSNTAVRRIMNLTLSHFKRTYLIIDALDECNESKQLAEELQNLLLEPGIPPMKIILLSRKNYDLVDLITAYPHIEADKENEEDLKAYINACFPDIPNSSDNNETMDKIRKSCFERADGMFQWVKLAKDSISGTLTGKMKLNRIQNFGPRLNDVYNAILEDIFAKPADVRTTAVLVLQWTTYGKRRLTSSEMLQAVADLSQAVRFEPNSTYASPDELVAICANLVYVDKSGYFQLCHQSAQEYLNLDKNISPTLRSYQEQCRTAHNRLTNICLTYLLLKDFECGPAKTIGGLVALVNKYPFLEYAAQFWGWHTSKSSEPLPMDLITRAISTPTRRELCIQITLYDPDDDSMFWTHRGSSNVLHLLALFGLKKVAENLQNAVSLLKETDGASATPLFYSTIAKQYEMTRWLINMLQSMENGTMEPIDTLCAIHVSTREGWTDILKTLLSKDKSFIDKSLGRGTPLCVACWSGQKEAAATLIEYGADLELKDADGDPPLILATIAGQPELVQLLLAKGANPNTTDANGCTALHLAADNGHAEIAAALLQEATTNALGEAPDADRQTALHFAAARQSPEVIRVLCQDRTNIDKQSIQGYTPLHVAAWFDKADSARMLLELGALKEAKDDQGRTPLFIAADEGASDTVKVMIDGGCDVNCVSDDGRNILHAAANSGKSSVMRRVLGAPKADLVNLINKKSEDEKAPLHEAVMAANPEVARLLLKSGADPSLPGYLSSSPLHYAAHFGFKTMLSLILNRTKDPNPRNADGDTPLHFASRANRYGFIKQLVQECSQLNLSLDYDAKNERSRTALSIALSDGYSNIAKLLLKKTSLNPGPDLDQNYLIHHAAWNGYDGIVKTLLAYEGVSEKGYKGRSPLHCAAVRGNLEIVKLLSDPSFGMLELRDDTKATPLFVALANRKLDVANYLLDIKADHNVRNEYEDTLLHIAASIGDLPMVQRLLELGAPGDFLNWAGQTPFYSAVLAASIEIVDAFVAKGFNQTHTPNALGSLCLHAAAEHGGLEMIKKLDGLGAVYGQRNGFGLQAISSAAGSGDLETIGFLEKHHEKLDVVDYEGFTTLMNAAASGHPDTVEYILEHQRDLINCTQWDGDTALHMAARAGSQVTVRHLLKAGADPYSRNALGFNVFDSAIFHRKVLQELHKAGHLQRYEDLQVRRDRMIKTVLACCKSLLSLPDYETTTRLYHRVYKTLVLASLLLHLNDEEFVLPSFQELFWSPKYSVVGITWRCGMCGAKNFEGDKYVCKSCPSMEELCTKCYKAYLKEGREGPDAIQELVALENRIQPVRQALPESLGLVGVGSAMTFFTAGSLWLTHTLEAYEAWEQKYNPRDQYRQLDRPGFEFLKMIKSLDETLDKVVAEGDMTEEHAKTLVDLDLRYTKFLRENKPDKERSYFVCKNHEYLAVTSEERDTAKSAGINLDSETGRMTKFFLEKLQEKYSKLAVSDSDAHSWTPTPWKAPKSRVQEINGGIQTHSKSAKVMPRPAPPRSYTMTTWKPVAKAKDDTALIRQTKAVTSQTFDLSKEDFKPQAPRRAQTMPVKLTETAKAADDVIDVEIKGTRIYTEIENQLECAKRSEPVALDAAVFEEEIKTQRVTVSFEEQTSTAPKSNDEVEENDDSEMADLMMAAARTAYMRVHQGAAEEEEMLRWIVALNVTDAMIPGFCQFYLSRKMAEREAAEELSHGVWVAILGTGEDGTHEDVIDVAEEVESDEPDDELDDDNPR